MRNLLFIELKKHLRERKLFVLLLLSLLIIILLTLNNILGTFKSADFTISFYEQAVQNSEKRLADTQKETKTPRNARALEYDERLNEDNKNMLEALKSKDVKKILAAKLAIANTDVYAWQKNMIEHAEPIREKKDRAAFLQYLTDNQINAVPGDISELNGLYMLYILIKDVPLVLWPAIILFMVFNTVTRERTQETLKFLLQQPYRRSNVLLAKFLSSGFIAAVILLLIYLTQLLFTAFIMGIGDGRYLVPVSQAAVPSFVIGESAYLAISDYLIITGFLMLISIIFYTALGLFISVISPNVFVSFFLSALSFLVPFIIKGADIDFPFFISDIQSLTMGKISIYIIAGCYLLASAGLVLLSLSIFKRENVYH